MSERMKHVVAEIEKATKRLKKMPLGSPRRGKLARWIGCLEFTRLTIANEEPKS